MEKIDFDKMNQNETITQIIESFYDEKKKAVASGEMPSIAEKERLAKMDQLHTWIVKNNIKLVAKKGLSYEE